MVNYTNLVFLQRSRQHQLEQENQKLKQQVVQYSIAVAQKDNYETNIKDVKNLQISASLYNNFYSTIARAIIDINYLVNNKLLIDRGSNNGIDLGDAVANQDGIVGQINVVNKHNAQIVLITNPDYKIYLQSKVTNNKMLAQGVGDNHLLVRYLSKSEKINVGDILVTTGLDDIYPANIPVARVINVLTENNGFNSAICEPVTNFNKLQYVLVLKNSNK